MSEPNVLFTVTGVVVTGLAAWVGYTLATAKEPWTRPKLRPDPVPAPIVDVPVEPVPASEPEAKSDAEGGGDGKSES